MYIYKLLDENKNLLYVGKTKNIANRIYQHKNNYRNLDWKKNIQHVEYAKCNNETDMTIYEVYYINKLKPKYNSDCVYNREFSIILPDLIFCEYEKYSIILKDLSMRSRGILYSIEKINKKGCLRYSNHRPITSFKNLWKYLELSPYKAREFKNEINIDKIIYKKSDRLVLHDYYIIYK